MSSIWQILSNPETAAPLFTAIAGWLGWSGWRKKRAATAAEVDRWASTAAGVVLLGIKVGAFGDDEAVAVAVLDKFTKFATAAGVEIKPEHEMRALLIAQEAVAKAGQAAVIVEAAKLQTAGAALAAKMDKLLAKI